MGRRKRPYAPGMIFHLVTRTHRGEPWYVPALRDEIAGLVAGMVARTDARLVAYTVMPNHLHILLRQGVMDLSAVMQPLLRRVALLVQRYHRFQGGVVERRYRDRLCASAAHVREALVYAHLNPWRAGLCGDDLLYRWTTHAVYQPDADILVPGVDPRVRRIILELFATESGQSDNMLCLNYMTLLLRRMRGRSHCTGEAWVPSPPLESTPQFPAGDAVWAQTFPLNPSWSRLHPYARLPDLRDFIATQLAGAGGAAPVDRLRGSWLPRPHAKLRSDLIGKAAERGFRTGVIARFFDVSPATVARVRHQPRS